MLYSHNTTIQIYRCREIQNTGDSPLFRYETFINFLTLVFPHEEKDRHNFYSTGCTIWPNERAAHPVAPSWTGPAQSQISTNFFFKIHQILSQSLPGMTSPTPQFYFPSGVFIMTFVIVTSSVRKRKLHSICVCTCTKSRIVQSLTEPNDKI